MVLLSLSEPVCSRSRCPEYGKHCRIRLPKTEALLKGKKLTPELIGEAAELAGTEVSPISDVRASAEYRVSLVKVAVRRSLAELSV